MSSMDETASQGSACANETGDFVATSSEYNSKVVEAESTVKTSVRMSAVSECVEDLAEFRVNGASAALSTAVWILHDERLEGVAADDGHD